jgi:hypothetical protein
LQSGVFDVESILGTRHHPTTHEKQFYVKWEGYGQESATWEPEENVRGTTAFAEFVAAQKAQRSSRLSRETA